jgi:hypothetical protein
MYLLSNVLGQLAYQLFAVGRHQIALEKLKNLYSKGFGKTAKSPGKGEIVTPFDI